MKSPSRPSNLLGVAVLCGLLAVDVWWSLSRSASSQQLAYIGPGAGIALLGSFLAVFAAIVSAVVTILTWPVRRLWLALRSRQASAKARVKRVVIVGLDGLEPTLVDDYLRQGLLPNLGRLRETGTYARLGTTYPPLSPVAWSSFSTGTNPGKHNIFDFLTRSRVDYRPAYSSVRIEEPRRALRLGGYRIPLGRARITALRKSKPFWTVLGEAGVFSAILRVPVTFPPDRFHGVQLSAMGVPDLLGSQGTFFQYTEAGSSAATTDGELAGQRLGIQRTGDRVQGELVGPANPLRADRAEMRVPFTVMAGRNGSAVLRLDRQDIPLPVNGFSEWVRVIFRAAPLVRIRGICRFYLKRFEPPFELYCSPIQIDPDRPVMPISQPPVYAPYLARLLGPFATLGLAEDTWALSEGVLSDDAFLEQVYAIHRERERMLFDALRRVRRGLVVCVFDAPDRVQHMFWRDAGSGAPAIPDLYRRMDDTIGRVLAQLDGDTALFVMSDHGFNSFRRGVDLNAWLLANGYLQLKDGAKTSSRPYLADVDWSGTRAYAIGLAGLYLNQQGREARGIVEPGEPSRRLVEELQGKLSGLKDPAGNATAIAEAVSRDAVYHGPYVEAAPDLIVGYETGYRVAWDAAVGKCGAQVFSDNTKPWSGDHCIHPDRVPGVLFASLPLRPGKHRIVDLAPTALELLGVEKPGYMDGRSLLKSDPSDPSDKSDHAA